MPTAAPITVVIGRFDDLVALGLRAVLAKDASVSVVARDIATARLGAVLRAHRPSVLILALDALPDLARVRGLREQHPQTRLVLIGPRPATPEAAQALAFGASACLSSETQARDLRTAIHLASRGLQVMPTAGGTTGPATPDVNPRLTAREADVLGLLRLGHTNAEIALALHIGPETVRTHASSIYRKLGVTSRRALLPGQGSAPGAAPEPAHPPRRAGAARPATRRAARR